MTCGAPLESGNQRPAMKNAKINIANASTQNAVMTEAAIFESLRCAGVNARRIPKTKNSAATSMPSLSVTLLACYLPAPRALRVDPAHALRDVFAAEKPPQNLTVEIVDTRERWNRFRETLGDEIERAIASITPGNVNATIWMDAEI